MPPTGHKVSPERLEEFRRIYNEASGEEITAEEALEMSAVAYSMDSPRASFCRSIAS